MNQNEKEGQSSGRTTGASGNKAEQQQNRTIEGQDSQPGKVWQESDSSTYGQAGSSQSGQGSQGSTGYQGTSQGGGSSSQGQYTGQGDTRVGGSDPGHGASGHSGESGHGGQSGHSGEGGIRGGFNDTRGSSSEDTSDDSTDRAGQGWGTRSDEGGSQGNSGSM